MSEYEYKTKHFRDVGKYALLIVSRQELVGTARSLGGPIRRPRIFATFEAADEAAKTTRGYGELKIVRLVADEG